ncbi:hypothetical protein GCM10010289_29650 [Streptomyces violascens]|uniref:Uncharacterized protein n=1 Tax=Streptomyces violascens TaxID=67381 RepID=A0ABQ3QU71_9ACTN|nr:hypothetical protein GCM10010289_29650 [Streptomyces violascens]GHI40833.1 hypothetical protein Sviol_52410 [Streptomyces violascens]
MTKGFGSFLRQAKATRVRAVPGSILRKATPSRRMRRMLSRASDDEESVLDGPLRIWRHAAKCGLGLCGVSVVIY